MLLELQEGLIAVHRRIYNYSMIYSAGRCGHVERRSTAAC